MKSLYNVYEVSILGDIDDQINAYDNSVPDRIEKWIAENCEFTRLKISDNINKNGLYEVSAYHVRVKNKNITSLTNGLFEWKEINNSFNCSKCSNLKSLEGAPKKVGGYFDCYGCSNLKSLEGIPKEVGGSFYCNQCTALKSLEGAPEKVGGDFYCFDCTSLRTLEGAPKKVGGYFDCSKCDSLISLKGAPKEVGEDFHCYKCKTKFTEDDVKKVSDVKGEILLNLNF